MAYFLVCLVANALAVRFTDTILHGIQLALFHSLHLRQDLSTNPGSLSFI
jgi:hypothetical protein